MRARTLTALCASAALIACSTQQCKDMKGSGSPFASLLCGGEGTPAPEPTPNLPSACQPRAVMPQFFALIDNSDPSLAGLRSAVGDLGAPICLDTGNRTCTADTACAIGSCDLTTHLCPCQTSYSPLGDVLGLTLRGLNTIADDKAEPGAPATPKPGCLDAAAAANLPADQRNRMCELRRTLDVLLNQNGGNAILNDPDVKKVLLSMLDYVQGKTDSVTHYDLLTPLGRMAAADTASCDPAALWQLLDDMFGYLTPQTAATTLGAMQLLLADPQTKSLLGALGSSSGGAGGRQGIIDLAHSLSPGIVAADDAAGALQPINNLLQQLVYSSSSYSDSFKGELQTVMTQTQALLAPQTGVFPPLQHLLKCMGSATVRCVDPSSCDPHQDELVGALYDLISRSEAAGGIDLSTLVGALKTLTTLDQTGQTGRTIRMVVQAIEGPADPTAPHEARDAVASLAKDMLTAEEGQKLMPALEVMINDQVLPEFLSFADDLLYTCKPPAQ